MFWKTLLIPLFFLDLSTAHDAPDANDAHYVLVQRYDGYGYFGAQGAIVDIGHPLYSGYYYQPIVMLPPEGSQLCSFPSSLLGDQPFDYTDSIGLLVSLSDCDVETKVGIAMEIQETVASELRYIIFYDSDEDSNEIDDLKDAELDSIDDLKGMNFISLSGKAGNRLIELVEDYAGREGLSPYLFGVNNEGWNFQLYYEKAKERVPFSGYPNAYQPGYSKYSSPSGHPSSWPFGVKMVLFGLLILSPCLRTIYLFFAHGGGFRFRRNEAGRITGIQYTPPTRFWMRGPRQRQNEPANKDTDKLSEEEILALPEFIYERPTSGKGEDSEVPIMISMQNRKSETLHTDEEEAEGGRITTCTMCSICIEDFEDGERLRLLPRCKHAFHTDCILPWLKDRQGCCPLCKTIVLELKEGDPKEGDEAEVQDSTDDQEGSVAPDTSVSTAEATSSLETDESTVTGGNPVRSE